MPTIILTIIFLMVVSYSIGVMLSDFLFQNIGIYVFAIFMYIYGYWWFYVKPQPNPTFDLSEIIKDLEQEIKPLPNIDLGAIKFTPKYVQFDDKNQLKIEWQYITSVYLEIIIISNASLVFVYKDKEDKKEYKHKFKVLKIPFNISRTGNIETLTIAYWQRVNGKKINVMK